MGIEDGDGQKGARADRERADIASSAGRSAGREPRKLEGQSGSGVPVAYLTLTTVMRRL